MKINTFVMYNTVSARKASLYEFTLNIVAEMIGMSTILNPDLRSAIVPSQNRLTSRCMPAEIKRRLVCKVCVGRVKAGTLKKASQTIYGCLTCRVALCLPYCFCLYHTVDKFENVQSEE